MTPQIGVDFEIRCHVGRYWNPSYRRLTRIPKNTEYVIYDTLELEGQTPILFKGYWAIKFIHWDTYYVATKHKRVIQLYDKLSKFIMSSIVQL